MKIGIDKLAFLSLAFCLPALSSAQSSTQSGWRLSQGKVPYAAQGSLSATATVKYVTPGDTFGGDSVLHLIAKSDLVIRFEGFADPVGPDGSPFAMNLQFEVSGQGLIYSGSADGINNQTVSISGQAASNGVSMTLRRQLKTKTKARAGTYVNSAQVVISQI